MNSAVYPTYLPSVQEAYTLYQNAVNGGGWNLAHMNTVTTPDGENTLADGKFVFAASLKLHDDTPISRLSSGLNSARSMLPVELKVSGMTGGCRPFMAIQTTSYLEVHANQNILVHT